MLSLIRPVSLTLVRYKTQITVTVLGPGGLALIFCARRVGHVYDTTVTKPRAKWAKILCSSITDATIPLKAGKCTSVTFAVADTSTIDVTN